ncbi:unnamed protein product [Pylaiella littoralis]
MDRKTRPYTVFVVEILSRGGFEHRINPHAMLNFVDCTREITTFHSCIEEERLSTGIRTKFEPNFRLREKEITADAPIYTEIILRSFFVNLMQSVPCGGRKSATNKAPSALGGSGHVLEKKTRCGTGNVEARFLVPCSTLCLEKNKTTSK